MSGVFLVCGVCGLGLGVGRSHSKIGFPDLGGRIPARSAVPGCELGVLVPGVFGVSLTLLQIYVRVHEVSGSPDPPSNLCLLQLLRCCCLVLLFNAWILAGGFSASCFVGLSASGMRLH